ncbi:MAG: hypothetical protein OQK32_01830 [Gammaproteobacteria bacterium]|nr:hypothetical protein [Gammaproteobacteria bacterium]MCW8923640.1 hypothetical protein [Gammaproteobacteria bacterium]
MKKFRFTLMPMFLLMAGLAVSGCTALFDKNLGSKVKVNKSAQVINADAVYKESSITTLEGQKAEKLMSRYRKEEADAPTETLLKDLGD